jgi:hypothetical protein
MTNLRSALARTISISWLALSFLPAQAEVPGGATVFWNGSAGRVHVKECRRFDPASMTTTMTLAEAKERDMPLCSRCPGSSTPRNAAKKSTDNPSLPESWVNPPPVKRAGDWNPPKASFIESELAPLVYLGDDGRLRYMPYSEHGDIVLDFSHSGYRKSEVPLPSVSTVITLEAPDSTPTPVGNLRYPIGIDSLATIQAAIDQVAKMPANEQGHRGAVLLKSGTWYVNGMLLVRSGVVLRGEGDDEGGTQIIVTPDSSRSVGILIGEVDDDSSSRTTSEIADTVSALTLGNGKIADAYVTSGSTRVTLVDAAGFKVGDYINIQKTTNEEWIELLGMGQRLRHIRGGKEGASKRPWGLQTYHHYRQIVAMEGNQITFDVPLPQSIVQAHGGGTVVHWTPSTAGVEAGVESLSIVSNYDTTVKDTGKEADFRNLRSGVQVNGRHSWVHEVSVKHAWFAAVAISDSQFITVRASQYLEPIGPKRGGRRYSFSISNSMGVLVYDCFSEDSRHDYAVGARTPGPNAFVRSTTLRGGASEPHHRWGAGTLYDNIVQKEGGSLNAINRGDSGSGHGWAAANTVFWNCNSDAIVIFDPETDGENNFAFGFTGEVQESYGIGALFYANTRAGYWGTPREGNYYGYAAMGNGHIESPGKPMPIESLFEQQLIDRIGKERAMQVIE